MTRAAPPSGDDNLHARFEALRTAPPENLTDRIMAALPEQPGRGRRRLHRLWPGEGRWLAPAVAGALGAMVMMTAWWVLSPLPKDSASLAGVTFVVHAPAAQQVELVGSFNAWQPGEIHLAGPDATGRWNVTVPLPQGRHEYLFLVDGTEWITDPGAPFHRPDGFGNRNAVIDVNEEEAG